MTYEQLQIDGLPSSESIPPQLRSFPQDSLVSLTALREKVGAIVTSVTCGEKLSGCSERLDRRGSSVKIRSVYSQERINGIFEESFVTLPRWGIALPGEYGALTRSERRTSAIECSLWHTETHRGGVLYPRDLSDADGRRQQERGVQRISSVQPSQVYSTLSDAASDELGVFGSKGKVAGTTRRRRDQRRRASEYVGGEWWEAEPDVGRVAHGVSARVDKLRCLGNAVVPYQAFPIFEAIAEYELSLINQ